MLDLFLIIILIISIAKPDILLAKNVKEKASDEQKQILVKNYRKNLRYFNSSFRVFSYNAL